MEVKRKRQNDRDREIEAERQKGQRYNGNAVEAQRDGQEGKQRKASR